MIAPIVYTAPLIMMNMRSTPLYAGKPADYTRFPLKDDPLGFPGADYWALGFVAITVTALVLILL